MSVEKMGYEINRRVVKIMNNRYVTETIGGKTYTFRSLFERDWALYLQLLKEQKQILNWFYEQAVYYFPNEKTAPVQYTPDFTVIDKDGYTYIQETKGWHDGKTNTKLRRMAKYYPDLPIELVLMRIPKKGGKGAHRRAIAAKYARRVIDASEIFRQVKGLI